MKKTTTLLLICCLNTAALPAQDLIDLNPENSCSYYAETITDPVYGFASSNEAQSAIDRIVGEVGLKPNFEIKAGNVPNAVATIHEGKRLIIYSQDFLHKLTNRTGDNWPSLSILAHEIGHHLNGHTITDGGSRPKLELEADEFSGFVLARLGASLEQAQKAIAIHGGEKGSHTHPPRSARLEAIAVGWYRAKEKMEPDTPAEATRQPKDEAFEPTEPKRETTEEPPRPKTTSITVAYAPEGYNCGLLLNINIGGRTFTPTSNQFAVDGVPAGLQQYAITGTISCPGLGNCQVYGSDVIDVQPGQTFWVVWQNTQVGQCSAGLFTE